MENYWYYTLSAIPQTLAAMIALAATFVVFKLNFISEKIKESRFELRRFILLLNEGKEIHEIESLSDENFLELYKNGLPTVKDQLTRPEREIRFNKEFERIIIEWRSYFRPSEDRILGYLNMQKDSFEALLNDKKSSIGLLKKSLGVTVLTILISLWLLPIPHSLVYVKLILILAGLSIVQTGYSVWKIAKL